MKMPNSFVQWSNALGESFQEAMDGTNDSFSLDNSSLAKIWKESFQSLMDKSLWGYPENQARRQESSYREIFISPRNRGGVR